MFGPPVSLNFLGEETHKTVLGGIVSSLIKIIIIVVCATKSIDLIKRKNNKYEMFEEPIDDGFEMNMADTNTMPFWIVYGPDGVLSRDEVFKTFDMYTI